MIEGGKGGGRTVTGLKFEKRTDILKVIKNTPGYTVDKKHTIYFNGQQVAQSFKKYALYVYLDLKGVDYIQYISKRLLPDEALYVFKNDTVFIIELKFQRTPGSVDEKLQTCDFKLRQYKKLFAPLNKKVEYVYILNDWFKKGEYKDVLEYVRSVGCEYYFDELPLNRLGLPTPEVK